MNSFPETLRPLVGYQHDEEYATRISGPYDSGLTVVSLGRENDIYRARMRFARKDWSYFATLHAFFRSMRGRYGTFAFRDWNGHDATPVGIPWTDVIVAAGDGVTTAFDLPVVYGTTRTLKVAGVAKTEAAYSATRARSGTTVTLVTTAAHGYSTSDTVTISGLGGTGFNGSFVITVTNATTFTYTSGTSGTVTTTADTGGVITTASRWVFAALGGTGGLFDKGTFGASIVPADNALLTYDATGRRIVVARFSQDAMTFEAFVNMCVTTGLAVEEAAPVLV